MTFRFFGFNRFGNFSLFEMLQEKHDVKLKQMKLDINECLKRFHHEHDIAVQFNEQAVDKLIQKSSATGKTVRTLCESLLIDYRYGLSLIARQESDEMLLTVEFIDDPEEFISQCIVAAYRRRECEHGGAA